MKKFKFLEGQPEHSEYIKKYINMVSYRSLAG